MLKQNVLLKNYTHYKIGGPADYFCEVKSVDELKKVLSDWEEKSKNMPAGERKIFVLGGGTNLLVSDEGIRGLVIRVLINHIDTKNTDVTAGAGTQMTKLVHCVTGEGLSGFEWAGGLPGTVGGAVFGNAGAFGGETKDNVIEVTSLNIKTGEIIMRNNKDCKFGYRTSLFKKNDSNEIILEVKFRFKKGDLAEIRKNTKEKMDHRIRRHPLEFPNSGSTFKNVDLHLVPKKFQEQFKEKIKEDPFPVIPAAVFIVEAGLKGYKLGGAQVSEKHPNFIINRDNATAKDIKDLITYVQKTVKTKFKVGLEPEVMMV